MTVFFHAHIDELEYMLRIAIAALCGGIIGFERSRMRKEAGLRTHIIVAVGAALLMIVSKYGFTDILDTPGIRVDGSRVAANVITGISFLGAGVIFVRDVAIGAGMYAIGIFSTALIMLIQVFARGKLRKLDGPVRDTFSITYENMPNGLEALKAQLKNRNIFIHHIEMEKNPDGTVKVILDVSREHAITCTDLADIFAEDEKIKAFRL